jgi:hypothetical protein
MDRRRKLLLSGGGLYIPQALPKIFPVVDGDSDIDDVFDWLTLWNLERRGECQLIGMDVASSNADAAGCLYAHLNAYGRTAIPVGASNAAGTSTSLYTTSVNTTYGVPGHQLQSDFPSTVVNDRTVLAASADNSVVFIVTCSLSSIVALLQSTADGISPLNGVDLVKQKVRAIFVVAGYWPSGPAVSDFGGGSGQITASQNFLSLWPAQVPVIFNGIELGDTWSVGQDGTALHLDVNNPAKAAMTAYLGALSATSSRNAWSQTAILAAVRGLSPYVYIADRGTAVIDGAGVTSWISGSGPHAYLRKSYTDVQLADLCNSILGVDPITWPADPGPFDSEATALIARMSFPLWTDAKRHINNFVAGTKSDADWTKLIKLGVLAAGNLADALLDWKGGASASISGGYTFKMFHGIHGDGATAIGNTNFTPTVDAAGTFLQNDNGCGVCPRVGTGANAIDFGNHQFFINPRSTGGNFSTQNANTAAAANFNPEGDARGLHYTIRQAAGLYRRSHRGVFESDVAQASQALVAQPFYFLCQNNNGAPASFAANRPLAAWFVSTGALSANFEARLHTLLRGLGSLN